MNKETEQRKKCCECGQEKFLSEFHRGRARLGGRQARCKACTKAYDAKLYEKNRASVNARVRAWQRANPKRKVAQTKRWRDKNPEKNAAHVAVQCAVASGELERKPCERCGSTDNPHAHHEDYAKQLDVVWLCVVHHGERHRELIALAS